MDAKKIVFLRDSMEVWETLSWETFHPSAKVDITLLLFGFKPAVRLHLLKSFNQNTSVLNSFFYTKTTENSLYMSKKNNCTLLEKTDLSPYHHTYQFGHLLGYPKCCSLQMAKIGENKIDEAETTYLSTLHGPSLINTRFYPEGFSLISHVPCHRECKKSISGAESFANMLATTVRFFPCPVSFKKWVENLFQKIGVSR